MNLSERMKANSGLVPRSECLADVGTDHGYVPICLVKEGRVRRAVAMDVNEGPLRRAEENIAREGLTDRISVRLSDGLLGLEPGEADVVLIAGMGGPLTIRILEMGKEKLAAGLKVAALVLQPQSEVPAVRRYLHENGWLIRREDMVLEDGKFYPAMQAVRGHEDLSDMQIVYGPRLLQEKHPVLKEYLLHEERTLRRVLENLERASGSRKEERIAEVRRKLSENREAQAEYA